MEKTVDKEDKISDTNKNTLEEFEKNDSIDTKIELYLNEIIKKYYKSNKKTITEECYGIEWGTKIVTKDQVVEQEHSLGKKKHQIFIGSSKIFDGDMIRYEIENPKEKNIDKIRIKIDEITNVETPIGKILLEKLEEKFVPKYNEQEDNGAKKILNFMKKEKLNKDDLLMALSLMFDEISCDKNVEDEINEEIDNDKAEIKKIIEKHSEIMENDNKSESTANLVKYKKSVFSKIVDWFYE